MKYQNSSTHCSKVISKVKEEDRMTDGTKKHNMPLDRRSLGHKKDGGWGGGFVFVFGEGV